ncbi:hypothetical protein [Streptomyces sp. NPDC048256]|uniref:hypothetical protein n=1 Tax=Streptomyces sp. NPDC048256 TaxID=3154613 RepID=UPI0033D1C47C
MTTTGLYDIETSEGDDGTLTPAEQIWTPCADGTADHGFIAYQGLFVAGIDGGADGPTSSRPPPRTWPGSTAGGTCKTG